MILSAIAIAISAATGWCVVDGFWPDSSSSLGHFILRLSVSLGLGLFFSSLVYFACLILGMTGAPIVVGFDVFVLACAYFFSRYRGNADGKGQVDRAEFAALSAPMRRVAAASLAAGLLFNLLTWLQRHSDQPMGFWDAFTIWNLKARFFYLEGGVHWQRAFHSAIEWSHTDYPLLLPLNLARLWVYGGEPDLAVSATLSALFTLLAIGTVFGAVAIVRGPISATLAGLALLAAPEFMGQGIWQVADIPVGFFLVSSLALISIGSRETNPNLLLLAGLMTGAAAWTKNEGSLVAISVLIALLCFGDGDRLSGRARSTARYLAGLALPLACVLGMKIAIGGESDLAADYGSESLARVFDLLRHQRILASYVASLANLTGLPLAATMAGLWFWIGFERGPETRAIIAIAALVLILQLSGTYFIYLITDRDLAWHLGTSNLRILVQLWPSAVLLFFIGLRAVAVSEPEGS